MMSSVWLQEDAFLSKEPPLQGRLWMTGPYCLSQALKACCSSLQVEVVQETFENGLLEEREALKLPPEETPYVRQVLLKGDGVPWVYARTCVPRKTYDAYKEIWRTLGTRLLGEAWLHTGSTVRMPLTFASIVPESALFQAAKAVEPLVDPCFARRSVFLLEGRDPMLVTELFLPTLPPYPEQSYDPIPPSTRDRLSRPF